ncbi:MAG: toxin-antitoxin system YwqK family antitoxin [Bacteroidales bacterium]|jgi:antitoxin component YwqK of YwqJK toxin-antitoxin module|nr:toxin-antitoxin system YwqK family antitoxin [Bacteroidales bacterium]
MKICRIIPIALLVLLSAAFLSARQPKNLRDAQGRKQGFWEAVDGRGHLVYTGYFKDDRPVGEMKRYHPGGGVRVIMLYDEKGERARSRFFRQNGELAARGNYFRARRDSVWTFYSAHTREVTYMIEYREGARHGRSQKFYPGGSIAEETLWANDRREGKWQQFFESGQVKMTATYRDNQLEGGFFVYYPDGKRETEGFYRNDHPEGKWVHYNLDGTVASTVEYRNGVIANLGELTAAEQVFFKRIEAEKGSIREPTVEDLIRESERQSP